jgi:hypothetical protein
MFMKSFRVLFIVSATIVFSAISANVPTSKKLPGGDKNKDGDTTKIVYLPKRAVLSDISAYPAHNLYYKWDTTVIHPYYADSYFEADSIVLDLERNDDKFTMPWKGIVTSGFGWRHGRPHTGTDIDLNTGDTVVAAFNGKVRVARVAGGYGNCVIIRHPNGLETLYGHLDKILVNSGDEVCSGQVIGLGGNTGHSFGSHLHFEMRYLGKSINTERFINYRNWELKQAEFKLKRTDFVMAKPAYSYQPVFVKKSRVFSKYKATRYGKHTKHGKTKVYVNKKVKHTKGHSVTVRKAVKKVNAKHAVSAKQKSKKSAKRHA